MHKPPLVLNVPDGEDAIPYTLAVMRVSAQHLAKSESIRALALQCSGQPHATRWAKLYDKLRRRYRFERDPRGVELLRNHLEQVAGMVAGSVGLGDCDDLATIAAAVLTSWGDEFRFCCCSTPDSRDLVHVYVAGMFPSGSLFVLDPQEGTPCGFHPKAARLYVEDPDHHTPPSASP